MKEKNSRASNKSLSVSCRKKFQDPTQFPSPLARSSKRRKEQHKQVIQEDNLIKTLDDAFIVDSMTCIDISTSSINTYKVEFVPDCFGDCAIVTIRSKLDHRILSSPFLNNNSQSSRQLSFLDASPIIPTLCTQSSQDDSCLFVAAQLLTNMRSPSV